MLFQIPTDNHSLNGIPKKFAYTQIHTIFTSQHTHSHTHTHTSILRLETTLRQQRNAPKNSLKFNSVCV